jgi:hypothetical protein
MRKSTIAGLTIAAALTAFAGQAFVYTGHALAEGAIAEQASLRDSKPVRHARKPAARVVEEAPKAELFRIPAHPVIRDCVHVYFPQCSGRGGFNDGTFGLPY